MAVKVQRKTQKENTTDTKVEKSLTTIILRLFARFDAIETYTEAIRTKIDKMVDEITKENTNNLLLHIKTITKLLESIENETEGTSEDLKE